VPAAAVVFHTATVSRDKDPGPLIRNGNGVLFKRLNFTAGPTIRIEPVPGLPGRFEPERRLLKQRATGSKATILD
jgi:hypothetical protein